MRSVDVLIWILVLIVVGVAWAVGDKYLLHRNRQIEEWRRRDAMPGAPLPFGPEITTDGELTTAAKYALWKYMLSILAVGGTVIGIVSGIIGYMLKDLVTEQAVQAALNKIQEPLTEQLKNFATADAALKTATDRVNDPKTFPKLVADVLFADHKEGLRGDPGPKGQDGKNGQDGKSPGADAVAGELAANYADKVRGKPGKDGESPTVIAVVNELLNNHRAELRGETGPPGKDGKDGAPGLPGKEGAPGKDGRSPGVDDVAAILAANYADRLRGKPGAPGKDAESPSVAAVVTELNSKHHSELRGDPGPPGKDGKDGAPGRDGTGAAEVAEILMKSSAAELRGPPGQNGKDGKDGKDGISPEADKVAELVVNQYGERLRGPGGKDGTNGKDGANGKDGQNPKAADVAAAIWDRYSDDILRSLKAKPRSR